MRKINMTTGQAALLNRVLNRIKDEGDQRPSSDKYASLMMLMKSAPVADRPKVGKIPHTIPGYEPTEVKLLEGFDATVDLPPGWAVTPMYDSGNNHAIVNAAEHVWRKIWNQWDYKPELRRRYSHGITHSNGVFVAEDEHVGIKSPTFYQ